ncbi:MAG: four helix bundle protein [bacterium]
MLAERLLALAAAAIGLTNQLSRTVAGRYISGQLMRACASAGANYEEACGAESRADFVHKMQIVLKELREACFWLRLLERSKLGPAQSVSGLREEASGLARMTAKSVVTAKSGR